MATLFDLAQAYLNQALPETFKYAPRIDEPEEDKPEDDEPKKQLLPVQSGSDNFSVYNPDPNRTRTKDDYSPYAARQFGETSLIGSGDSQFDINKYGTGFRTQTEANKFMDMYPDYYNVGPKTGIEKLAGMMPGQAVIKGIGSLLPTSDRGILENELTGQGFAIDDVGRFVAATPGSINTAENIMAGYSAYRTDASTFQKRRDMINAKMSNRVNPKTGKTFKQEKLDALDEAEKRFFEAKGITTGISDQRKKAKDPDYKSTQELIDLGIQTADDDSEDDMYDGGSILDTKTPTVPTYGPYSPTGPIVTGPTYGGLDSIGSGGGMTFAPTAPKTLANKTLNKGFNYLDINPGGGRDDGPSAPPSKTPDYSNVTTAKGPPGQISKPSFGPGSGGLGDYQIQPSKPATKKDYGPYSGGGGADSGGGGGGGGGKIVCTMMNESYGFGSFRNKIWLKHSKGLAPEYQKGYHKLFLPLVKMAKTNKVVKKILEHIAVHRTIDIRQESRGKVHLLGRVYRKILEPLCYFVGKHV